MTAPQVHAGHAAARRLVRLPNGRTGVLLYVPIPADARRQPARSGGAKAKVALHAAAVISVPVDQLELAEDQGPDQ